MPTASTFKNVAYSLLAIAVIYRVGAKELITGESKLFGIF